MLILKIHPVNRKKIFFLIFFVKTLILKRRIIIDIKYMQVNNDELIKIIQLIQGVFTNSEKVVFVELVKLSIDNRSVVTTKFLKDTTSLSSTAIYTALNYLQQKRYIKKVEMQKNTYEILHENSEYIMQLYQRQNQKAIENQ